MKNFDFDNDTSENKFPHPYISYMANERLQGEKQCHSKNYSLEMPCSLCHNAFESAPQKLNICDGKGYIKTLNITL